MKATLQLLAALVVLPVVSRDVAAQWNVAQFGTDRNQVYSTFGIDPAVIASVGYGRIVPMLGRQWQLGIEGGVVAPDYDTRDFRARAQVRTSIARWRSLHLVGSMAFITRGTENSIYRAVNFGADFTGALGVYRPRWFFAGEFGFDKAVITHITHSDWYRTHFYAEAKDGWYLNAGGTFHYGAATGLSLGRMELAVRAGRLQPEDFNEIGAGGYASAGIGFKF